MTPLFELIVGIDAVGHETAAGDVVPICVIAGKACRAAVLAISSRFSSATGFGNTIRPPFFGCANV